MRRRNVILLTVLCLLLESCFVQASVIIKTAPHANVKMEFGAQHVPPHDVALLDESAKVDGTTRLGIEVPHSHNHRNILIHKIGTYLTVVMKALAKTVAPSQNQDGKTHFDIHVDADLGENNSKDKKHDSQHFTIVHSKHDEDDEKDKGDCVKAVVIMSESDNDNDKKEEQKSSEKHSKDEHKKKDSHVVLHYSDEDSKDSKEHLKKDVNVEVGGKMHISKEKEEEKKEDASEHFKIQPPKDWESFKKTQDMLKEKGFILQLDRSYFISEENKGKPYKVQTIDIKKNIKYSHEGKSLSKEEMEESERNLKSLELTDVDPEEMWISMVNPTDANSGSQSHMEKNDQLAENNYVPKTETAHTASDNASSKAGKELQTAKATFQSGEVPVIVATAKPVTEAQPKGAKAVTFETMKQQTPASEKLSPSKTQYDQRELSFTFNEIPSHVSSHFEQTSYSTDRNRAMTIVSKDPTMGANKGFVSQPVVFQVKDKLTETSETSKIVPPHFKMHDDSREVIMRLAPGSKIGSTKKAQTIDVKKVTVIKPNISDQTEPHDTALRQESIRKLPMANIPTFIDVLQNSPPQEVQRLTQLASSRTSQESQKDYSSAEVGDSPAAPVNRTNLALSKSPREFQMPEMHVSDLNLKEGRTLPGSSEDFVHSAPTDYKEASRNEKSHTPIDESIAEASAEKSIDKNPDSASKELEITKKSNPQDHSSAEEPRSLKYILENPDIIKSMEVSVTTEPERQQKELVIDSLNTDDSQLVQKNVNDEDDHGGERNQKTFRNDLKNVEEDNKAQSTFLTKPDVVEDVGIDSGASHALTLHSLTTSAEEARALDISPQAENQSPEVPALNGDPVEEIVHSPRKLNQKPDISDTAEKKSEEASPGKNSSPSVPKGETEHKEEPVTAEVTSVKEKSAEHDEPKTATPSDIHTVLPVYDAVSPVTESSTTPSLPEKESASLPKPKERELILEDEANTPVANLEELNEGVQVDESDRDGRIYSSPLDSDPLPAPLSQHAVVLPETPVFSALTPPNNAIHDPKSPFIYSYYPAFYPKAVYASQNKTEESKGLYGKPSPRVICVSTDTGKVLDDTSKIGDQSNAVVKYSSDISKASKEDDKLMLLKQLHEDIQKLKQQLKIQ